MALAAFLCDRAKVQVQQRSDTERGYRFRPFRMSARVCTRVECYLSVGARLQFMYIYIYTIHTPKIQFIFGDTDNIHHQGESDERNWVL